MFIKNIIINGFRSYGEQSFPEPLSECSNVIVGRNGSGKSNFFGAIQLILDRKYQKLSVSQRRDLLHTGGGRPVINASVEIIFDNSDERLTIPGRSLDATVSISRTIGLQQDEYRIAGRRASAEEVQQLFESAGFSTCNPYYVVEQGKIVNIASSSPEALLEMIMDVAGAHSYDHRRAEAAEELKGVDQRRRQIEDLQKDLEKRLEEATVAREEQRDYDALDERRRIIKYCIYSKEEKAVLESLRSCAEADENAKHESSAGRLAAEAELDAITARVDETQQKLDKLTDVMRGTETERHTVEMELESANRIRDERDLALEDASRVKQESDAVQKAFLQEHDALENRIMLTNKEFEHVRSECESARKQEDIETAILHDRQLQLYALDSALGRESKFNSKNERDQWIDGELAKNERIIATGSEEAARLERDAAEIATRLAECNKLVAKIPEFNGLEAPNVKELNKQCQECLQRRDELNRKRRFAQIGVAQARVSLQRAQKSAEEARQRYEHTMNPETRDGLRSFEAVMDDSRNGSLLPHVHGPLISLLQVDEQYRPAVETALGRALFNIVVDNFDTSRQLLSAIDRSCGRGRLGFFPIDTVPVNSASETLRKLRQQLPNDSDVSPLFDHVRCSKKVEPVFLTLLSDIAVVPNLRRGVELRRSGSYSIITVAGDEMNRTGAIRGGFVAHAEGKITLFERFQETARAARNAEDALKHAEREYNGLFDACEEESQRLRELQAHKIAAMDVATSGEEARSAARTEIDRLTIQAAETARAKTSIEENNKRLLALVATLKIEKKKPLMERLTPKQENQREELRAEVERHRRLLEREIRPRHVRMSAELQATQDRLSYLQQRLEKVKREIDERTRARAGAAAANAIGEGGDQGMIGTTEGVETIARKLQDSREEVSALEERMRSLDGKIEKIEIERRELENLLLSLGKKKAESVQKAQIARDAVETHLNASNLLYKKREELIKKREALHIRPPTGDNSDLSPEQREFFRRMLASSEKPTVLAKELEKINVELNAKPRVNRFASTQFEEISSTLQDLKNNVEELVEERKSIDLLISSLDKEKDMIVDRTFSEIQKHFTDVFAELVRIDGARARLTLTYNHASQNDTDAGNALNDEGERIADAGAMGGHAARTSRPRGALIEAQFDGDCPVAELSELSGGQKSVVALALIFAIQRSDPAPFYLLDEIDAALDTEARHALADLITSEKSTSQFIIATFHNELLDRADRVIGVSFLNRVSHLQYISVDEGRKLLQLTQEENTALKRQRDEHESASLE